jgi:hypothetical protein
MRPGIRGLLVLAMSVLATAASTAPASATTYFYEGAPFAQATATYLGTAIGGRANGYYDLQPSILYEPSSPGGNFKMWWLGRYKAGDADLPPGTIPDGDRIYYSHSEDGGSWSPPQVVLKGLGGTSGTDAADDHLVGSPSVLHINGTYYMFYEAFGKWMTAIDRFWSPGSADTLVTSGQNWNHEKQVYAPQGFNFEGPLGFAPLMPKAGTIPIYAGEVVYSGGTLKRNHFLDRSTAQCSQGVTGIGIWGCRNHSEPVFWLYTQPGPGRVAIYECFDSSLRNTYATRDPGCEGHGLPGAPDGGNYLLGYAADVTGGGGAATTQTAPDMRRSNQNRIMLATSTNGVNWTRFNGAEEGGSVIAPQLPFTTSYPNNCDPTQEHEVNAGYGSGYPSALERDGFLELYFTDSLEDPTSCNRAATSQLRIRIPISQIANASAYKNATRQNNAPYGDDIKWSPNRSRYFVSYIQLGGGSANQPGLLQSPMLMWSDANPDPTQPAPFPDVTSPKNELFRAKDQSRLPTNWDPDSFNGRFGANGGIAGDGLGHTIDSPTADPNDPPTALDHSVFHMFFAAQTNSKAASPFDADFDHILVFGFDQAAPEVATAPAVSTWGPQRLDVFIRGTTDDGLWHRDYAGGQWSGWEPRGGSYSSAPSAVSRSTSRIDVAIRDAADAHVARQFWNGSGWFSDDLGGTVTSAPALSSWSSNRLDVFVRGLADHLYHRAFDGTNWSAWEDLTSLLGVTISSAPSAVSWGAGRIDMVARASDGRVYHVYWENSSGWQSDYIEGVKIASAPAISSWGPGRLDVFGQRSSDSHLVHTYYNGSIWMNPWENVSAITGNPITSSPSAVSWGPGRIDVVARAAGDRIEHIYWSGSAWFHEDLGGGSQ